MKAIIYKNSKPIEIEVPFSVLTKNQKKNLERIRGDKKYILNLRYDDECGNGHNTFSVTLDVYQKRGNRWIEDSFGCQHETVAEIFPEYTHMIPYHLMSSHGPMHYLSNSLYHASDKDHWGLKKGEVRQVETRIRFSEFPITFKVSKSLLSFIKGVTNKATGFDNLEIREVCHEKEPKTYTPKYTFSLETKWHQCPFDTYADAKAFLTALQSYEINYIETPIAWGEGKEPDLNAARNCAIWPDAELSDFTEKNLLDRLLLLIEQFKKEIESLGFTY
jgi:hypothetical protein